MFLSSHAAGNICMHLQLTRQREASKAMGNNDSKNGKYVCPDVITGIERLKKIILNLLTSHPPQRLGLHHLSKINNNFCNFGIIICVCNTTTTLFGGKPCCKSLISDKQ